MRLALSPDLKLPLDAATQTFAFLARKGGGKTYAAGKLVELLMAADVQCVIVDVVGNWFGLRLAKNGKDPSRFDIPIIGGLRGDIPLQASAGELIADIVVDTGRSLILDISQFSLGDRKRFATTFAQRLWQRKKGESHPSPVMLVLEESQLIVPQHVDAGSAEMVGIYEEVIRLGRNYGIGCVMISQRPQSVNKEVLNQTECLFVGQINGSQEREALKKWITHQGMDPNLVDELPALKQGTMYVWSPQWLQVLIKVKIAEKETYDASATPKVGEKRRARELKPLDLGELKERMAETIAKSEANDPSKLRKRVIDLERELARVGKVVSKENFVVDPQALEKQIRLALEIRNREWMEQFLSYSKKIEHGMKLLKEAKFVQPIGQPVWAKIKSVRVMPAPAVISSSLVYKVSSDKNSTSISTENITGPMQRILDACAWLESIGNNNPSQTAVAFLAGYTIGGGAFNNPRGRLNQLGLIQARGNTITLTDQGRAVAHKPEQPLDSDELQSRVMQQLPTPEQKILRVLLGSYPSAVENDQLARDAGYEPGGGAFNNPRGRLKTLGLVEYPERGMVKAADLLFL